MSVEVDCPYCGWPAEIGPARASRPITCWNCEREYVLLEAAPEPAPVVGPAGDSPPGGRANRLPARTMAAAVIVVAVGTSAILAWVNARRAADEAGQAAERARAAQAAAESAAEELQAARRDAELAWAVAVGTADPAHPPALGSAERPPQVPPPTPADHPGAVDGGAGPADVPPDVREAATAALRKVGEAVEPLFRTARAESRAQLARLKAGLGSPGGTAPAPTGAAKTAAVKACEARLAAAERALKAWEGKDLDFFAPDLTAPDARGAVGRVIGREVRVVRVLDHRSAVVRFLVETPGAVRGREPRRATAVVTGVDGAKLSPGRTAGFDDLVVVTGTAAVGADTYPRLAVFSASRP